MTRDLHVTPYERQPGEHRADKLCWCKPRPMRNLLEPSQIVWRHRGPHDGADTAKPPEPNA